MKRTANAALPFVFLWKCLCAFSITAMPLKNIDSKLEGLATVINLACTAVRLVLEDKPFVKIRDENNGRSQSN